MSNTEPLLSATLMRRLQTLSLSPFTTVGSPLKGDRLSYKRGVGQDFIDYRDYGPGDDPRYVDWNAAARTDKLYVRVFHEERDLKLLLVVDTSASMGFGTPTRLHIAARLCAALGFTALCGSDRVTIQPFALASGPALSPLRGKAAAPRLFSFLQKLEPAGPTSLANSLRRITAATKETGTVIVISDLYDCSWQSGISSLLARGHRVVVLQLLLDEEVSPALRGDVTLIDSETGASLDVSLEQPLLDRYQVAMQTFLAETSSWCRSRGVTHVLVDNTTPLEHLVLTTLRQHKILR